MKTGMEEITYQEPRCLDASMGRLEALSGGRRGAMAQRRSETFLNLPSPAKFRLGPRDEIPLRVPRALSPDQKVPPALLQGGLIGQCRCPRRAAGQSHHTPPRPRRRNPGPTAPGVQGWLRCEGGRHVLAPPGGMHSVLAPRDRVWGTARDGGLGLGDALVQVAPLGGAGEEEQKKRHAVPLWGARVINLGPTSTDGAEESRCRRARPCRDRRGLGA